MFGFNVSISLSLSLSHAFENVLYNTPIIVLMDANEAASLENVLSIFFQSGKEKLIQWERFVVHLEIAIILYLNKTGGMEIFSLILFLIQILCYLFDLIHTHRQCVHPWAHCHNFNN